MDQDDEMIEAGEPIYKIVRVTPGSGRNIDVEWENGRSAKIDLEARVTHRLVLPALATEETFRSVAVEEWGSGIWWPGIEGAAIPSSLLHAWAEGKDSDFD
ncbi:DUF2442 domain-containing protein [Devosia aurantiaca]|uniref:DUF2442 domain-containing protein n=1 Tax=Devosia aurantiaca TaxID=2714858 RepID=A0A6M1SY97_9HYPH|nr:DUF2442 domain-containing protein [Devosia aurantiaca]NGP19263.1 DUF2442 domain-containing protein [Devosia aurantiaca]